MKCSFWFGNVLLIRTWVLSWIDEKPQCSRCFYTLTDAYEFLFIIVTCSSTQSLKYWQVLRWICNSLSLAWIILSLFVVIFNLKVNHFGMKMIRGLGKYRTSWIWNLIFSLLEKWIFHVNNVVIPWEHCFLSKALNLKFKWKWTSIM